MSDRWSELASQVRKPKTLVVNLYGGPGTGKSTTAALVFGALKQRGVIAELVTEFAKDLIWEQRQRTLADQVYVFGKQQHRLTRLLGEVDVIITDSPLMLTPVYSRDHAKLNELAYDMYLRMFNLDIYLERDEKLHPYNPRGRYQKNVQEAESVDRAIRQALITWEVRTTAVTVGPGSAEEVATLTLVKLKLA